MTIPFLTQQEFLKILHDNGWEVVSNEFWNDYNRIIVGKDNYTFVVQVRNVYHYPIVVTTFTQLGIPVPEEHRICYEQWEEQKKKRG